jgi:hypothetical protein
MEEFIELIDKDECCINYKRLEELGILKFKDTHDINRVFEKNNLKKDKDYVTILPRKVAGQD